MRRIGDPASLRRRPPRAPTGRANRFSVRRTEARPATAAAAPGVLRCGGGLRRRPPVALGPWVLRRRQAAGGWRCGHPSCQTACGPALSAGGGGAGSEARDATLLPCCAATTRSQLQPRAAALFAICAATESKSSSNWALSKPVSYKLNELAPLSGPCARRCWFATKVVAFVANRP